MTQAQLNMQNQQLKTCGIHDELVLDLLFQVPRNGFVPEKFRDFAFSDSPIPLGHQQMMMTPLEEASILQALQIKKSDTVLEVGTGSGYLTALMAKQAKHVISIEYYSDLTSNAQKKLDKHGIQNVTLITGDGIHGYLEKAPYDIIVLTGSVSHLNKCFHPQLYDGGKLIAVVGQEPAMEVSLYNLNADDRWEKRMLFETSIAPLIDRFEKTAFEF